MLKRNREAIIDQEIKSRPYSSFSQKILAYGILFISIYFFIEIILEYLEQFDLWSLRKLSVLFVASIIAIVGFIIGIIERKRNSNHSLLGIVGNLSLFLFYAFIVIQNGYYRSFI